MQVFLLTLFLKLQIWGKSGIKFIKGCLQVLVLNFIQYHLQTCQVMDIDFSCYTFMLQFLEDLYPLLELIYLIFGLVLNAGSKFCLVQAQPSLMTLRSRS